MAELQDHFDVAVIGAGVNGAGIARDAALRGLRVVVLDKSDLCSGTSAWSSRLIHGGLRYLEYAEIPLVYESLHERRNLRKIAPHLVKPLRINIPIYKSGRRGPLIIRLGMIAYDLLSIGKAMPGHDILSRDELLAEVPGLNSEGLRAGARYFDAQVAFTERLVLENLLAAKSAGASIKTWHRVTRMNISSCRIQSIDWTNERTGEEGKLTASVVVNAGGPWVDRVLATVTSNANRLIGGTKGSHIIVGRFDGAPNEAFYVEASADGRPFFIIPWNEQMLIGTTDIRSDETLEELRASSAEVDYLLAESNRVFPNAKLDVSDIHYTYAGMRPLPHRKKGPESAITRKHIIKVNKKIARNLISIIGGKLTTYRNLAEQTVDRVGKLLQRRLPECRTHDTPLPGGWGLDEAKNALESFGELSEQCVKRLLEIYGRRAQALADFAISMSDADLTLDEAATVLAAEVRFAIREEFALTLADIVFRRTMIGLWPDQGRPLYESIANIAADELLWDERRRASELRSLIHYSDSMLAPK
ncbi:MAG: glycerol-3-phosphate dehydrogenase [Gammaproteobacteria bacterium]|nr:glycerol-3-phosphate dehydrogenase [Gammaproteobacteria bacterium]